MEPVNTDRRQVPWGGVLMAASALIYAALAFTVEPDILVGDEARYVSFARNLTQGFYVTEDHPDFLNGPGYPLVLVPFVAAGWSFLWARMLNGIFIGAAAVFLFRTVKHYAGQGWALAAAFVVMVHPNSLRTGTQLLTEPLTLTCVCAWLWSFCLCLRGERRVWWWGAVSAISLACLVMTRVIFGHVITVMFLAGAVALVFTKKSRPQLYRSLAVMAAAFVLCLPYLAYTKATTGKSFCWSTVSGELLYWMTSTNPGENGYWFSYEAAMTEPDLAPNHREFFERVTKLPVLERDAAFGEQAVRNLKANPKGVLRNWACNVVRLPLGFPRAFHTEDLKTVAVVAFNGPMLLLCFGASLLVVRCPRCVPTELGFVAVFALVYLGGSTLASSVARYFLVVTPLLWPVIAVIFARNLSIRLNAKPMH